MNHIDVVASRRLASLNPTSCPEGIEPRLWRKTLSQRIETHLALVETLLFLIDGMDEDCDLEDNADFEPSLGGWEVRGEVDLEGDNADDENEDPDLEPSLGSLEASTIHVVPFGWVLERNGYEQRFVSAHQLNWATSDRRDLELGEGDDEPDQEGEPWLGFPEEVDQEARAMTGSTFDDGEQDTSDFEPSLGAPEIGPGGNYLIHDGMRSFSFSGSQEAWANGTPGASDMEEEAVNEDGEEFGA